MRPEPPSRESPSGAEATSAERGDGPLEGGPPAALDPAVGIALEKLRAGGAGEPGGRDREADLAPLKGARLVGEDLSGLDLDGVDLSGADLGRARLEGTSLLRARLTGAKLFEVSAAGAELSGADLRGAHLDGADLTGAGLGMADLRGATLRGADLSGATLTQANLAGADLKLARLVGTRAREANLQDADLSRSILREAELDGARVQGATFDGADLRHASLQGLTGYKGASWLGVDIREIDFTGAYMCRSCITDQNFIEEFRTQGRLSRVIYEVWRLTSDCGRSVTRWAFCTAVLVLGYAWLYGLVEVDYGAHETLLSPLYFSVVTLTTLGYGDVVPASVGAQVISMLQVVTGYVMLGGLLSIFSSKMANRGG